MPIFQKQIIFANKVIVTFVDVIGEDKYKEIETALKEINIESQVVRYCSFNTAIRILTSQST